MKKAGVLTASSLFSSILLASFASAADVPAQTANAFKPIGDILVGLFNAITSVISPISHYIIGDTSTGEMFVARVAMFLIVYAIIYVVLNSMDYFKNKNGWARVLISLAVGILGVRFLDEQFIQTAILSNSAFAVAVTAGLPFVAFWFIVKDWTKTMRKISWIFFGVIMLALWSYRYSNAATAATESYASMIYPLVAICAFLMAVFDGLFQKALLSAKMDRVLIGAKSGEVDGIQQRMTSVQRSYNELKDAYVATIVGGGVGKGGSATMGYEGYRKDMAELRSQLDEAMKETK